MKHLTAVVLVGVVLVVSAPSVSIGQEKNPIQDKAVEEDLAKLQGKWELTRRTGNGVLRSVKVIEGNTTRLTRFDENGAIYWAHTSSFKIEITDNVRIFTFFNLEVNAGPSKGRKSKERSSYIYKVVDDNFVEARGLLVGQEEEEPRIVIWKRVNDELADSDPKSSSVPLASEP